VRNNFPIIIYITDQVIVDVVIMVLFLGKPSCINSRVLYRRATYDLFAKITIRLTWGSARGDDVKTLSRQNICALKLRQRLSTRSHRRERWDVTWS